MQKKIVINFTKGTVTTYGDIESVHLELAKAKLHFREVEPCVRDRVRRKIGKFIKCLKYAFSSKEEPRHIIVSRPIALECIENGND